MTHEEELARAFDQNMRLLAENAELRARLDVETARADLLGRNLVDMKEKLYKAAVEHDLDAATELKADLEMTKLIAEVGR